MTAPLSISKRMEKARTGLLLDHPFFGSLLFRLKGQETYSVRTMATDGISLFYNPDFVETLSAATLAGTLAHEVMHPALCHHTRRAGRAFRRWNEACDYAINPLLLDAGLKLPNGVLVDERFRGLSAEEIYNRLGGDEQGCCSKGNEADAEGGVQGLEAPTGQADESLAPASNGGIGEVLDAPSEGEVPEPRQQEREWIVEVHQAATVASRAAKLPAGVGRSLEGAAEASVNWRELLRRTWSETTPADYLWARPNRRHIWNGLYLPGLQKDGVGEIAIAVDCSGSVNERQLRLFEAEVRSILEGQRPQQVYILYFDTSVQGFDTFGAGERIELKPVGGGGTDFGPCFEWLAERRIQPQAVVFLTDLYGTFPATGPGYPVLWASTGGRQAPFGQVVPMQAA